MIKTCTKSLFSLSKTLIPRLHQPFPFHSQKLVSKFPPNRFSTSALQQKSPFEANLLRILDNEIEFESDYAPPHQPDKKFNAFVVEDRPGEQFVTLKGRSAVDENVKIEATMFDGYAAVSPNPRDGNSEPNPQLHISLLVDVSKGKEGEMLEFVCSAWPDRLEIQKCYVFTPRGALSRPYTGPDFRVLDKTLQSGLYEFLKARGVNDELCVFLHHYIWNKDKLEHIQRLKLLRSYLEK